MFSPTSTTEVGMAQDKKIIAAATPDLVLLHGD